MLQLLPTTQSDSAEHRRRMAETINELIKLVQAMPTSAPPTGSSRIWYDATDSNRVKFQP